MAERRPLTIIGGQVQELPSGDTVAGAPGSSAWKEPVTVYNSGSPEVVFDYDGDVVMVDAS
jgi:hypothetical protein